MRGEIPAFNMSSTGPTNYENIKNTRILRESLREFIGNYTLGDKDKYHTDLFEITSIYFDNVKQILDVKEQDF